MKSADIMYMLLFILCDPTIAFHRHKLENFRANKVTQAFQFTGTLRPGKVLKMDFVPSTIKRPSYISSTIPIKAKYRNNFGISLNSDHDIAKMRDAGVIARQVLDSAIKCCLIGVSTNEINELVHKRCIELDSYPSPLGYKCFPKSCCTSINEVMCHGIPDSTILKDGDIVNIDVTIFHDDVHSDCSETVIIGNTSDETKNLVKAAHDAMKEGISICGPGVPYNKIGEAIQIYIKSKGYSTPKSFCGHGIGLNFHEDPLIRHVRSANKWGKMEPGHIFTIEPILNMGNPDYVIWPDEWTIATRDGLPSAQFEHTVLITKDGHEELTRKLPDSPKYFWEL